jgi:hypothetical protein
MAVSNCAALKMELCAYLPLRKTKKEQPSSLLMAKYNAQCAKKYKSRDGWSGKLPEAA